jgi:hypothetical protein
VNSVVILVFGSGFIAVGFAIYRGKRAGNATNEPVVILNQSGRLTEAVPRLYSFGAS